MRRIIGILGAAFSVVAVKSFFKQALLKLFKLFSCSKALTKPSHLPLPPLPLISLYLLLLNVPSNFC